MENNKSPFLLVKSFETRVIGALSPIDIYSLARAEQKVIKDLKTEVIDARLDIRDYELSETREEQLRKARESKKRLEHVRKLILAASEYNVFSAVDVAQLSAELEQIMDNIY